MPPAAVAESPVPQPWEVVLVTGGSGFLGQHIIKLLHERDPVVKEIRVIDLQPYVNRLGHAETKAVRSWVADVRDTEATVEAYRGAHCVIHCAALVAYGFPSDRQELHAVNVEGTRAVLGQCVRCSVPRLVHCSCASVTLVPYLRTGSFCAVVNQTESRAPAPADEAALVDTGLAAAKLRAERLVMAADGRALPSGGRLRTTALRPTPLYGERDPRLVPALLRLAEPLGGRLPRLAGPGGKHQLTYVGNAAWAHLRAKDTLRARPAAVAGLPVFVTDDTPPEDLLSFVARAASGRCRPTGWHVPSPLAFLAASLLEAAAGAAGLHLPAAPRAAVRYLGSVVCYDRLRAAIHLDYCPPVPPEEAMARTAAYYADRKL